MLTAHEAAAIAHLLTPKDFSLEKRIEIRIWDAIQNGGTHIIYAGEMTDNVLAALRALGYQVVPMLFEDEIKSYKIKWEDIL